MAILPIEKFRFYDQQIPDHSRNIFLCEIINDEHNDGSKSRQKYFALFSKIGIDDEDYERCTISRLDEFRHKTIIADIVIVDSNNNYAVVNGYFIYLAKNQDGIQIEFIHLETEIAYKNDIYSTDGDENWIDFHCCRLHTHLRGVDSNILIVRGCFWADRYEYRFVDFSNPIEELPIIPFVNVQDGFFEDHDDDEVCFISLTEFEIKRHQQFLIGDNLPDELKGFVGKTFDQLCQLPDSDLRVKLLQLNDEDNYQDRIVSIFHLKMKSDGIHLLIR